MQLENIDVEKIKYLRRNGDWRKDGLVLLTGENEKRIASDVEKFLFLWQEFEKPLLLWLLICSAN